ncbi:hypothetical protein [Brucella pituitosa]|uniref:hypothetical protein n=1 Tax=Brucella pituitosa TaxID=571256 RepID=UPI003F4A8F3B
MTPDSFSAWLSPGAVAIAMCLGALIIIASVRDGWLSKSFVWATVFYGTVGAIMVLSPKWTTVAFEFKDFKAQIANLEDEKRSLQENVNSLKTQIAEVSELGSLGNVSAKQALAQIDKTRASVDWAKFLPTTNSGIKIAVQPNDMSVMQAISSDLNVPAEDIERVLNSKNYTLLKSLSQADLSKLPPSSLWFNPTDRTE